MSALHKKQVIILLVTLFLFALAGGFFTTFIAVDLYRVAASSWLIGAVSSAFYLGVVGGAFKSAHFINRIGHTKAFIIFAVIFAITVFLQGLILSPVLWIGLRFIAGVVSAGIYLVIESWLLTISQSLGRGKLFALYMTVFYLAQALGQFVLSIIDIQSLAGFEVVIALTFLAIVPFIIARPGAPSFSESIERYFVCKNQLQYLEKPLKF